jgi:hypothetical protein
MFGIEIVALVESPLDKDVRPRIGPLIAFNPALTEEKKPTGR